MKRPRSFVFVALTIIGLLMSSVTSAQAGVEGMTYTDDEYGYAITWNDAWFLDNAEEIEGLTYVRLFNGVSQVLFFANPENSITGACVFSMMMLLNNQPSYSNVKPLDDGNGNPVGSVGLNRSFTVLTATFQQGDTSTDVAVIIDCRQLVPDQSTLMIFSLTPLYAYEEQHAAIDDLLTGLVLPESTATGGIDEPILAGETGPVFVSDHWRISVVAVDRAPSLSALGLEQRAGKEWVVVVADITNWSSRRARLIPKEIELTFDDGGKPVAPAAKSSGTVAEVVGLSKYDPGDLIEFEAEETRRLTLAYAIPDDRADPALTLNTTSMPLDEALDVDVFFGGLIPVTGPETLVEATIESVIDGATVHVRTVDGRELDVHLIGVDAPTGDDCFAVESADRVEPFVGETVWLEGDGEDQNESKVDRYVWTERTNGSRQLLNRQFISGGFAAALDEDYTRFDRWFRETERASKAKSTGLWGICNGPHGDAI